MSHSVLGQVRRLAAAHVLGGLGDADLVRRFAGRRDPDAFAALVHRHGPMVWRVCRQLLRHTQDAEDAMQATFLVLARRAGSLARPEALAAWLHGVARRVALQARKEAVRRRERQGAPDVADDRDAETDLTCRELQRILHEELGRLGERHRAPLLLCLLEGLTQDEAARRLGWSKSTLRRRLDRARDLLRRRLDARGVTLAATLSASLVGGSGTEAGVPALALGATVRAGLLGVESSPARVAALAAAGLQATAPGWPKVAGALIFALGLVAAAHGTRLTSPQETPSGVPRETRRSEAPRTDLYGDALPPGAVARLGTVRFRLPQGASGLALTPDDRLVVTGGNDGIVSVWDRATGRPLRSWRSRADYIPEIALSPDGKTVAVAELAHGVSLWDVATGRQRKSLGGPEDKIYGLAYSADGQTIYGRGGDGAVRVWRVATGEQVARWPGAGTRFARIVCSADGKTLAVAHMRGEIVLWDTAAGRERRRLKLKGYDNVALALALSPDGRRVAAAGGDSVVLWRADTGEEEGRIPFPKKEGIISLAFAPDGKHLAGGEGGPGDAAVRLWEWPGGKLVRTFSGHTHTIWVVRFTSDGKQIVSSGNDHTIRLWDVASGREALSARGHVDAVRSVAFAPDGRTLVTEDGSNRTLRLWDVATSKERLALGGQRQGLFSAAFTPDGRGLVTGSSDSVVLFLDAETGKETRHPLTRPGGVVPAALSPDGKKLVTLGKDNVGVQDLSADKESQSSFPSDVRVVGALWAGERPLLLGQGETDKLTTVLLRDLRSGRERGRFETPRPARGSPGNAHAAVTPDQRLAVVSGGNSRTVRLFELGTGRERREFAAHPDAVLELALSSDGRTLATTCEDGRTRLWDMLGGKELAVLPAEQGHVLSLAFSPDGRLLATGGGDTTALLWDMAAVTGRAAPKGQSLSATEQDALWNDLASDDAQRADRAVTRLRQAPAEAVPFLAGRVRPAVGADLKPIGRLIADLDGDEFARREAASKELEKLGGAAEGALRRALAANPTPEAARRLEALIDKAGDPFASAEGRRLARALEVLEGVEARPTLAGLAKGEADAWLTREAKAALGRLTRAAASTGRD